VTQHFKDDRTSLEKELGIAEVRLGNAIGLYVTLTCVLRSHDSNQFLPNSHNSIQLGRSNSLAQTQARDEQSIHETRHGSSLSQANPVEPTARIRVQQNTSPQLLSRTFTGNTIVAEPDLYSSTVPASLKSFSTISNSSPNTCHAPNSSHSISTEGDRRSPRSRTYSDPATRSSSVFSHRSTGTSITQYSPEISPTQTKYALGTQFESWNRNSIAEGDEDGPRTHTLSIRASPNLSTEPAQRSPNLPETRGQGWNEVCFQPSDDRRRSSTHFVQGLSQNTPESTHTFSTRSRGHTLSASDPVPTMTLPSSMIYRMDIYGEIRM
jgi:hypothetical protein